MKREVLEAEILEWMSEGAWRRDEERFERLALALFRLQFAHCEPYARYARALGRTPDDVERAAEIPAVPTGAFKEFDLRGFAPEQTVHTFRTSGTSAGKRGQLHLDTLDLYEASLLSSLRQCLLRELVGRAPLMRFLAPPPDEAPDSSLTHMFETLRRAEGAPGSAYDLHGGRLDVETLRRAIHRVRDRSPADGGDETPIVLAGTSFAFVHLLDAVTSAKGSSDAATPWRLPHGSRVLETGGFKGRSREVPADVLREALARLFDIPERSIVNQYGMTELGSQFYDSTLSDPVGPRRKLAPPWTRVRLLDPATGLDVPDGAVGRIRIDDLANTGSVAAIQTADLGRAVLDDGGEAIGFEVLGREAGAEMRGCSIATDVMLSDGRAAERSAGSGETLR